MKIVQVKNITFNEGRPKICVPIVGKTDNEILDEFSLLSTVDYDLAEFRADHYQCVEDSSKLQKLLKKIRKVYDGPLLFTFRSSREGGVHKIPEEKYLAINRTAISSETIDLIDVELFSNPSHIENLIKLSKEKNIKIVMSNHDFNKTPSKDEIIKRLVQMQKYDADITKIAVMPKCEEDVLTLLDATLEMKKSKGDRPCITISMSSLGMISRLSGELFGSCMTFAAAGNASAPGQVSVKDIRNILNMLKLS